jgi:glycosyltransferase involved in cell wall biosynthesis
MASRKDYTLARVQISSISVREPELVSVVVPAHNASPFIGELLSSLLAQTYRHFEVLIFDDGSTDNTSSVASGFTSDHRIKIFRSESNIGVNRSTSVLLPLVRGEFWAHPGADDVLESDFLSRRVALLEKHPTAVLAHGRGNYIDSQSLRIAPPYPALDLPTLMNGERALSVLLQHNVVNTPSVLIRTNATKEVMPYFETDWRYAQDWFLWLLLISKGGDLAYDQTQLHGYRIHGESLTNNPTKSVAKRIETRLVPLCGLSTGATFSEHAKKLWERWKGPLYDLYLTRACRLRLEGCVISNSLPKAASAYSRQTPHNPSLVKQCAKRGFALMHTLALEKLAKHHQRFPVSGLASIDDPIFRS